MAAADRRISRRAGILGSGDPFSPEDTGPTSREFAEELPRTPLEGREMKSSLCTLIVESEWFRVTWMCTLSM